MKPVADGSGLRWGVLGTAAVADTFLAAVRAEGSGEVRAVASRSRDRAEAWASARGVPLAYGSHELLLGSGEVDAVYIPLPNALHGPWTLSALEAGLPVLCEKPLAHDLETARRIQSAADQAGRIVVEGFMYRHHPVYDTVRQLLDGGVIGTLRSVTSRFTFVEERPDSSVTRADLGGGALLDVGCYCVHLSRMVTGREPRRVAAAEIRRDVDETFMGILEFPGGVLAQFEVSIVSGERHGAELHGTLGTLRLPRPWVPGTGPVQVIVQRWGEEEQVFSAPGADPWVLQIRDFDQAVREGRPPRWPLSDAVANTAVLDALGRAARREDAWTAVEAADGSFEHTDDYD
ncbi:MAG: Gfo/Idh/MocA family oxidoreductase [Deltaproteobacteria bacterium]|nr:Gfo/Idh/MocA family oxidoreductase [Deltaproteobacteria bacterium]